MPSQAVPYHWYGLGTSSMNGLTFEILVDDSLAGVTTASELSGIVNKRVLSLINDFEDAKWRYSKFQNYLWDNIALTALSQKERSALVDQNHTSLVAAAQNLRLTDNDKIGQGSEIAEVFLYGLMRHKFGALPVVPKIFYKQNAQDNAKGSDSVHIVVSDDDFTLWFGEAKFYNSIADARLDSIVSSVITSLSTSKLKKENSIITSVSDLDYIPLDDDLRNKIKLSLDNRESIDSIKSKIHIPILVLHECPETASQSHISDEYKNKIISIHKDRAQSYFSKQIKESSSVHMYNEISFHFILFPVPNKEKIVDAFVQSVAFYKGQV